MWISERKTENGKPYTEQRQEDGDGGCVYRGMKISALLLGLGCVLLFGAVQAAEYEGDVTGVRVIRRMEQHPGAALVWEPYIAQWKPKHLVAAYGAGIPGKTDMGSIYASVSTDDGDT